MGGGGRPRREVRSSPMTAETPSTMRLASVPPPEQCSLRLLLPLHVPPDVDVATVLLADRNGSQSEWELVSPHDRYVNELLPDAKHFLFASRYERQDIGSPRLLRVRPAVANRWFHNRVAVVLNGDREEQWWARGRHQGESRRYLLQALRVDPRIVRQGWVLKRLAASAVK